MEYGFPCFPNMVSHGTSLTYLCSRAYWFKRYITMGDVAEAKLKEAQAKLKEAETETARVEKHVELLKRAVVAAKILARPKKKARRALLDACLGDGQGP